MAVTLGTKDLLELLDGAGLDSKGKNIISTCPYCGREEKFGISVQKDGNPWQCLHAQCGERGKLYKLLGHLGRLDLVGPPKVDRTKKLENIIEEGDEYEEIILELDTVALPDGYKRVAFNEYLDSREFNDDDYFTFEVGAATDFRFRDYVIFPIRDAGHVVGYVSRHVWDKKRIDRHNDKVTRYNKQLEEGEKKRYKILRYRNSDDNETGKMLYNYDNVVAGRTHTVIVVEGVFDVINVTRELELYDDSGIVVVACFGSKLSREQIYKLQLKGVTNVVLFYDEDAVRKVQEFSTWVQKYFDVLCACYLGDDGRDAGDLKRDEILEILDNAQHPYAFKRNIISKIL